MALLSQDSKDRWVFTSGKHDGEFLDDVASEDPSYLEWLELEWEGYSNLPSEARHAIAEAR